MSAFTEIAKAFDQLATSVDESPLVRRALYQEIAKQLHTIGDATDALDPDETTVVSNPPTQAEVQAINDRLLETRQALCQ